MKERYGKQIKFNLVLDQICRKGKTISELAEEYDMNEEAFIKKMKKGLFPKQFSKALEANEKNIRQPKNCGTNGSEQSVLITTKKIDENQEEEKYMAKRNEERKKRNLSPKGKATKGQRKQTVRKPNSLSEKMNTLYEKRVKLMGKISDKEKDLNEAKKVLAVREETVFETQHVFEDIKMALNEAKCELNDAKKDVERHSQTIEELNAQLEKVETRINKLKNKSIYLVAPGYTGKKPEFGTYYSTTEVQGYDTLSVLEVAKDYVLEPKLEDMVTAGYDSYREYMEGLQFVMLCVEYKTKDIEYEVLVNDERLKTLLRTHLN